MNTNTRMSPLTALFIGIFGTGAITVACATAVVLYGMRIVDGKAHSVLDLADRTVSGLPELLDSLPPTLADVLNDRRAPEYAANLEVQSDLVADDEGHLRPVLRVSNTGSEVVSLLAVRVAALDANRMPVGEWTEVVATPIAVDDEWRGPLMPGKERYLLGSYSWRGLPVANVGELTTAVEVAEVRVWRGNEPS